MRQTGMQEVPEKLECALPPADREQLTWSPELQPHIWIPFRWWRSPVTSTVPLLGKDSFQEIDIAGITMPITKHNFIVKDVNDLADTIRRAFRIAKKGRPGPVLVDIPKDVTANKAEYKAQRIEPVLRVTQKPSGRKI